MPSSQSKIRVIISSSPDNGLAEMFCGYLTHYGEHRISATLLPKQRALPDHVRRILQEDGIHTYGETSTELIKTFDFGVVFNDYPLPKDTITAHMRRFAIDIANEEDKHSLRQTRETVKRLAIDVLGEALRTQK